MKILITGGSGFIGKTVAAELVSRHQVITAGVDLTDTDTTKRLDLTDASQVREVLKAVQPEAIINCAGIVENSEKARLNPQFTTNLLEAVAAEGLEPSRIVVTGSAAEYGIVAAPGAVNEDTPRHPTGPYGQSKVDEVDAALRLATEHQLPVTVARLFNPLGLGMHPRMLIPNLVRQLREVQAGERSSLEISRLDALRDYVDVRDVARAIAAIVEGSPAHSIYNVGSGRATSNQELLDLIVAEVQLPAAPSVTQTAPQPEPNVASQADITRLRQDLQWQPSYALAQTVKEIIHDIQNS